MDGTACVSKSDVKENNMHDGLRVNQYTLNFAFAVVKGIYHTSFCLLIFL